MSSIHLVTSPVRRWLVTQPGRCPGCAGHLATQGHQPHCPLGFRARFALAPDGSVVGTLKRGPE